MPVSKKKEKSKIIWTSTVPQTPGNVAMKFRPPKETPKEMTKGKMPCAEAVSVQQVGNPSYYSKTIIIRKP